MTDKNACKNNFHKEVQGLLSSLPDQLKIFNELWQSNDYRLAYSILEKIITEKELKPDESYKKADKEFYWLFIG